MTLELGISLIAIFFGIIGFVAGIICFVLYRQCVALSQMQRRQLEAAEKLLFEYREILDQGAKKTADNARRLAWLETRVRQPKATESEAGEEIVETVASSAAAAASLAPNITERRHRVLSLASRGQNIDSIASTLGMLEGEVELIISLNRTA